MHLCVKISTTFMAPIAFAVAVTTVLFNWRVHHNVHEVLDCFASYVCVCVCRKEIIHVTTYSDSKTKATEKKELKNNNEIELNEIATLHAHSHTATINVRPEKKTASKGFRSSMKCICYFHRKTNCARTHVHIHAETENYWIFNG